MNASHPAWLLAGMVAAGPSSMIRDLRLAYFGVKDGASNYLKSAPHADADIAILRYVRAAHLVSKADYVTVGSALHFDGDGWSTGRLYFPSFAVRPDVDQGGQAVNQMFAMVEQYFPGSKLYFYRAGTHVQVYLKKLVESHEHTIWGHIVNKLDESGLIHKPWIQLGTTPTSGQRWSAGEGYPTPAMYKWHQLAGKK